MKKMVWSYSKQFKYNLTNIFYEYKKKYNLKTKLEFSNYLEDSFYNTEQDKIRIFLPLKYQRLKNLALHSLYHELKHVIDYYQNPKKILEESKTKNRNLERRAIRFSERKVKTKYKRLEI